MKNYKFKLTPAYCLYNGIAVVSQEGASICFMTENPSNELLQQRLKKAFSNYIDYVLRQSDCPAEYKACPSVSFIPGERNEIRRYVSSLYSIPEESSLVVQKEKSLEEKRENEAAAVILLDTILADARSRNATDIHIEKNCIRFRICGQLKTVSTISEEKLQELIQRIKFLAGLNVLEKRRSQDGHFVYGKEEPVFVRVSVMGIVAGNNKNSQESVVIRLLDTKRMPLALNKLGFTELQTKKIEEISSQKNGLIIICGPTGAGKSTTAAAILVDIEKRKSSSVKIISIEDPPEYIIPGVTQIQVDEKINNSFSDALSHVFRQDPDVLMIGEIRDEVSAGVAIRAALTGHLVLATLHTSTAAGAIFRLENLGLSKTLIASLLRGVVVQELKNLGGKTCLAADVSVPMKSINQVINKDLMEEELEEYFEHATNYQHFVEQAIGIMQQKHTNLDFDNSGINHKAAKNRSPKRKEMNKKVFVAGLKNGEEENVV